MNKNHPTAAGFDIETTGFMQLADAAFLAAVARGEVDLNKVAREELASRGLDHNAKWVGFRAARALI